MQYLYIAYIYIDILGANIGHWSCSLRWPHRRRRSTVGGHSLRPAQVAREDHCVSNLRTKVMDPPSVHGRGILLDLNRPQIYVHKNICINNMLTITYYRICFFLFVGFRTHGATAYSTARQVGHDIYRYVYVYVYKCKKICIYYTYRCMI